MKIIIEVSENELTDDEIEECIRIAEINFSNVTLLNDDGTVSERHSIN